MMKQVVQMSFTAIRLSHLSTKTMMLIVVRRTKISILMRRTVISILVRRTAISILVMGTDTDACDDHNIDTHKENHNTDAGTLKHIINTPQNGVSLHEDTYITPFNIIYEAQMPKSDGGVGICT